MTATNTTFLMMLAQNLLYQVPSLLVCLVACLLVCLDWRRGGKASLWALLGFGTVVVLGVVFPVAYAFLTFKMTSGGGSPQAATASVLTAVGFGSALLHALGYVFLLLAVLNGRAQRAPEGPPFAG
jgi:hypothetical protein